MKKLLLISGLVFTYLFSISQVITPFQVRKTVTQKGGIVFLSNTSSKAVPDNVVQNEMPPSGTGYDNNYTNGYVDIDGDASTWMSSSDQLDLSNCSEITWAGLYWGGDCSTGDENFATRNQVKLKVNSGSYINLTADYLKDNSTGFKTYHCYKDITSIMQANGLTDTYTIANVATDVGGKNLFGGWTIVVIYKNNTQNMRNLTVFDGLANVMAGTYSTVDIPISGFQTPLAGPVTFELGLVVYDGDRSLTGDQLLFKGGSAFYSLSNSLHNSTDMFNSTISRNGVLTPHRIPSYNNTLGYDANIFSPVNTTKNYIGNNAISAVIRQTTGGETFLTQVVTSAIDVYEPDLRSAVRVKNITHPGNTTAEAGDILEYTVNGLNIGSDPSINTFITDTIEGNAKYVPGSLKIIYGPNSGTITDAAGDDQGEYIESSKVVRVRIGNGANAALGGLVNNSPTGTDSTQFTFRVQATNDCVYLACDNIIDNSAHIVGTGNVSGNTFDNASNPGVFNSFGCPISGSTKTPINTVGCSAPTASANSPICQGGTINFTASYSPSATYLWTGPNGFSSTLREPSISGVTGVNAGAYTANIYITGTGCHFVYNFNADINIANAGPDQIGSTTCGINTVTLAANKPTGTTGSWSVSPTTGASFSDNTSPTSTFTGTPGTTYTLTWTLNSPGCGSTTDDAIVLFNSRATSAVLSGTTTLCGGGVTNLSVAITGGTSPYSVVISDGSSQTTINNYTSGSSIPVSPTSTKTYTLVSVTDAKGCTPVTLSGSAVVTVTPQITGTGTLSYSSTATAGPRTAGTAADDNTSGTLTWSNTGRTVASDNSYTTIAFSGAATSHYLKLTKFGFTIPAGAIISGIEVAIERKNSTTNSSRRTYDNVVELVGGTGASSNLASATYWSSTEGTYTYGGSTNLWGRTDWTDSQINDPNFGIRLQIKRTGTSTQSTTASVDYVTVKIYYQTTSFCDDASGIAVAVSGLTNVTNYFWTPPAGGMIITGQNTSTGSATFDLNNAGQSGSYNVCVTPSNGCQTASQICLPITVTSCANTAVSIVGNVFWDTNLADNIVNGTGIGKVGTTQLYVTLVNNTTNVAIGNSYAVNSDGSYRFITGVTAGTTYKLYLGTTSYTSGNAVPVPPTPTLYTWTGEIVNNLLNTLTGNDGTTNGILSVTPTASVSTVNANFGIKMVTPPVTNADSKTVNEDNNAVIDVTANDTDADGTIDKTTVDLDQSTAGVQSNVTTAQGVWTANTVTGVVTLVPTTNYSGTASINYTVKDNDGNVSNTSSISVIINPVNDPPVGTSNTVTTLENSTYTFSASDFKFAVDPEGDALVSISIATLPAKGTLKLSGVDVAVGQTIAIPSISGLTFEPVNNESGTAYTTFTYKGNDADLGTVAGTMTINVTHINVAPVAVNDAVTTDQGLAIPISVLTNDINVDGTISTGTVDLDPYATGQQTTFTIPGQGTFTDNGFGVITFTPIASFYGTTTTIYYTVQNSFALTSNKASIIVTVVPAGAPTANNDNATTNQNVSVDINVTSNDVAVSPNTINPSRVDLDPLTAGIQQSFEVAGKGQFSVDMNGLVTFVPEWNFNGVATVNYTVRDNANLTSNVATITVTVNWANTAPFAVDDVESTNEDAPVSFNVTTNDYDLDDVAAHGNAGLIDASSVDLDPTTPAIDNSFTVVNEGTYTVNSSGVVTFTPALNFNGTATQVAYSIKDKLGLTSDLAYIVLTVNPVNDAPVAVNDATSTAQNTAVSINVTTNDTDVDGTVDPSTVDLDPSTAGKQTSITVAGEGTYTVNSSGVVTFTPLAAFYGVVTPISYTVNDNLGLTSASGSLTIEVIQSGSAPIATNDIIPAINEGSNSPSYVITTNDSGNGNTLVLTSIDLDQVAAGYQTTLTTSDGLWTVNTTTGGIIFAPSNANYNGTTSVSYTIDDNLGNTSNVATITLTVNAVNDAPSFVKGANQSVCENSDAQIVSNWATSLSAGPSDESSQTLSFVVTNDNNSLFATQPSVDYTGNLSYTPATGVSGSATVSVKITDNGGTANGGVDASAIQTFTITINPLPNSALTLSGSTVNIGSNGSVTINSAANGVTYKAFKGATQVASGTGTGSNLILTVNSSYLTTGANTITFTADNGTCSTTLDNSATIYVNTAPVTVADSYSVNEGATLTVNSLSGVLSNDTDVDGNTLTAIKVTNPAHGTFTLNADGSFTYIHDGSETTSDSFTYKSNDGYADGNTVTVTITINPVNDAPVTVADSYTVAEGGTLNVAAPGVLSNDTDAEGNALTAIKVTNSAHGTLTLNPNGSFTYTHDGSETTSDSFTYKSNDGTTDGNTVTVSITVTPVNDPPVAMGESYTVAEGGTLTVSAPGLLFNDTDVEGNTLSAVKVSDPLHGTLTINTDGSFTYVHDGSETISDSYTYKVFDGTDYSNIVTVSITVTPVNDAPVTVADNYTVAEGGTLTVAAPGLLSNDTDAEGNSLTAIKVANPSHGVLTLNANGSFTYTHDGSETTSDSFTYKSNDGTVDGNTVTVSITVTPVNDAPVTVADSYTVAEGGTLNISAPGVLSNDTDAEGNALTAIKVTNPSHGVLTLNANGSFTYTHDGSETTSDSFTYKSNDGTVDGNTVTVSITINPVNDAPVTVADSYTVAEGGTLNITAPGVLGNDTDAEGNTLTAIKVTNPAHGTLTLNSNGSFTYTHDGSETTSDNFTYKSNDGSVDGNTVTVTITITPVNDAPVAVADSYTVAEGGTLNILAPGVLSNDTDAEGNTLTAIKVTNPAHGTLTLNADGSFTYTHDGSETTSDSFTYKSNDGTVDGNTVTVTFTITPVNDAPVTVADSYTVAEGGTLNILAPGVLSNDTDAEGNALTAIKVTNPAHGTLTLNADGSFTYTHDGSETTSDSFTYKSNDGTVDGNTVTVTITITPVNDAPVAVADSYTVAEGGTLSIAAPGLLANDSDAEGDGLTAVKVSDPTKGTLTLNSDGSFTYIHDGSETTTDSYTYKVFDGAAYSNIVTVSIDITPVNDPPVAANNTIATPKNTDKVILTSIFGYSDNEGDALSLVKITTLPTVGTLYNDANGNGIVDAGEAFALNGTITKADIDAGKLKFKPVTNAYGVPYTTFGFKVNDGTDYSTSAYTITINVTNTNSIPVAVDDNLTVNEDGSNSIDVATNDTNLDDGGLVVTITTAPLHGTYSIIGTTVTYTPNPNYNGTDSFVYQICDGNGDCSSATVYVTINAVNDNPIAVNDAVTINEDGTATGNLLSNDSDPDGDPLTINTTPVVAPTHGSVVINSDGTFTYTPDTNFNGTDTFTYEVCDTHSACSQATVTITINPVNDNPVAGNDAVTINEDGTATGNLLSNDSDPDGDPLTINTTPVVGPTHGSVVINSDGTFTYTPDPNYNGTDTFTYEVCDNHGACSQATVTITINAVNDAPVAVADSYSTLKAATLTISAPNGVLKNDTDVDNDPLTAILVSNVSHGTLTLNADGSFTYVHDGSNTTSDSFTYKVNDGTVDGNTVTVTIAVNSVNTAPVAADDSYSVVKGNTLTVNQASGVLSNDTDAENNSLSAVLISTTLHGTLTLNADGSFTYVNDGSSATSDSFTYKVNDGFEDGNTATVTITITTVNSAPVAIDDSYTVVEGATLTINSTSGVLSNDTDADSDALSAIKVTNPSHGTLTLNANGSFTYTHDGSETTSDSFTYKDNDGKVDGNTATVTITITPVNDLPVAVADNYSVNEGETLSVSVPGILSNDTDAEGSILTAIKVTNPSHGTLTLNANGSFTYVHDGSETTSDSFTYKVNDGTSDGNTVTVTITIIPVNDLPIAVNDVNSIREGENEVFGNILANDTDAENNTLQVSSINGSFSITSVAGSYGTLTCSSNGDYTYTLDSKNSDVVALNEGQTLTETFTYKATDGTGESNSATLVITINGKNDAEVIVAPEGFTPDGDGINDTFVIDGLSNYPENELVIFNRWGTEVYRKKNYNNEWNGRSSVTDSKLPVGTYFYVLTVKGKGSAIKGFIYLKY